MQSTATQATARRNSVEMDPRWLAIRDRDSSADGKFFYAVRTTGVYCRPSCGSRLPNPENVEFHDSCAAAEARGYRPCKRCRPSTLSLTDRHAVAVTNVCKLIESAESVPTLREMAAVARLSPYHLHRVFKSATGVTPRAYALAQRTYRLQQRLSASDTVTMAYHDAGINASSRFYEKADEYLGMTPKQYRAGGARLRLRYAVAECSLGTILVASSDKGICAISLGNDGNALAHDLRRRFPRAKLISADPTFRTLVDTVVAFVEQPDRGLRLALDIRGTAFQRRVWEALRRIPPGHTMSYKEVAALIGSRKAVRAVANACAKNMLAVAIPCHRVVRTDGSLSGYRWGIERKRALLTREKKR